LTPHFLLAAFLLVAPLPLEAARERVGNVDVFIVLDESGSMKPIFQRVTAFIADALVRDYLSPGDYLCVIGFSDFPRVRVSQRLSSAGEKENLSEIVRRLNVVPQGFTDMGRSLEETLKQLQLLAHPSHQQILLILTDGVNQPPRDSPYYYPAGPESGASTPPSLFNDAFLGSVRALSAKGHRMHVVGIGKDTDARKLAEALGAGYTLLREWSASELSAGLAHFWDDTINLVKVESPGEPVPPGAEIVLTVKLSSTSEQNREVELAAVTVTGVEPAPTVSLPARRVAVPSRQDTFFEVALTIPPSALPGDYRATVTFEQTSAVKFYPPDASFTFHVPSFWERYGSWLAVSSLGVVACALGIVFYRRRPIPIVMVVDGQVDSGKPVLLRIGGFCAFGGGATDRFRVSGLPQKTAVLERATVDRLAFISTKPDVVPTVLEYALGEPIEVRASGESKRVVRFERAKKKAARPRSRPSAAPRPTGGSAVDFR